MKTYGHTADGTELLTQWETVLYFLKTTRERITSWRAIQEFGFTRLSDIVYKIEKHTGIYLKRRRVEVTTRYGAKVLISEYWYED